jgi:hypothetical protein
MKHTFAIYMLFLFTIGCATSVKQESDTLQKTPKTQEEKQEEQTTKKDPVTEKKETPAGTPMGRAQQAIDKSSKEMQEAIKIVEQASKRPVKLNCSEDPQKCFQRVQSFFYPAAFDFDEQEFWFSTTDGERVGVDLNNGNIDICVYEVWVSYKKLTVYQNTTGPQVYSEFYLDSTKNELMVHRFKGNQRVNNSNYVIANR